MVSCILVLFTRSQHSLLTHICSDPILNFVKSSHQSQNTLIARMKCQHRKVTILDLQSLEQFTAEVKACRWTNYGLFFGRIYRLVAIGIIVPVWACVMYSGNGVWPRAKSCSLNSLMCRQREISVYVHVTSYCLSLQPLASRPHRSTAISNAYFASRSTSTSQSKSSGFSSRRRNSMIALVFSCLPYT